MLGLRHRSRLVTDRLRVALQGVPLECAPWGTPEELAARPSPYATLRFSVGGKDALVCFSRPSCGGREIFGELLPYGELWRMGANEPTTLHLPFSARIGELRVPRGRYALYGIPAEADWELVVNRAWWQWGSTRDERGAKGNLFTSAYTARIAASELGRTRVTAERGPHVEQLTYEAVRVDDDQTDLVLSWENVRLPIPITTG